MSDATNLVPGDTNHTTDIFVRDLVGGSTRRVSVGAGGQQANGASSWPSMSRDGLHIGFLSAASNLVPGDTNGTFDVFVRDLLASDDAAYLGRRAGCAGRRAQPVPGGVGQRPVRRVPVGRTQPGARATPTGPSTSSCRDRLNGTTRRASVGPGGVEADGPSTNRPAISADGRFVAFDSSAANLVAGDTNEFQDIFVRDLQANVTSRVSVGVGGTESNRISISPTLSADGRYVGFQSDATNLVATDTNGIERRVRPGPARRDEQPRVGGTRRVQADGPSFTAALSAEATTSGSPRAPRTSSPSDTNQTQDVFVRD